MPQQVYTVMRLAAGKTIEGKRYDSADMIKFEIPHFSHYYYDGYY